MLSSGFDLSTCLFKIGVDGVGEALCAEDLEFAVCILAADILCGKYNGLIAEAYCFLYYFIRICNGAEVSGQADFSDGD